MKTRYSILVICCFVLQQFVIAQTLYTPKGSVFMGFMPSYELNQKDIEDSQFYSNKCDGFT